MRYGPAITAAVLTLLLLPAFSAAAADKPGGGLDIRLQPVGGQLEPPAEMLLVYPSGTKLGKDPRTGEAFPGTDGSYYDLEGIEDATAPDEPFPRTLVIDVPAAPEGAYTLTVFGTGAGSCELEIHAYGDDYRPADAGLVALELNPGDVRTFTVTFMEKPVVSVTVVSSGQR